MKSQMFEKWISEYLSVMFALVLWHSLWLFFVYYKSSFGVIDLNVTELYHIYKPSADLWTNEKTRTWRHELLPTNV